jgi:hypothetical protein
MLIMSEIEKAYRAQVEKMSPKERVARAAAMFQWTREILARQLVAELGEMSADELRWRVALRQYGAEPQARALIEEELPRVSGRDLSRDP